MMRIQAFYFGSRPEKLWGIVYHPDSSRDSRLAVVLCCPFGQEQVRTHSIYNHLALLLAEAGFTTLRFDYRGCGDSFGAVAEQSLNAWVDDVEIAVGELRDMTQCESCALVGVRLGGTLTALAAERIREVSCIVLWEPIVDGQEHWDLLKAEHQTWLQGSFAESLTVGDSEILGFAFNKVLKDELCAIDLLALKGRSAERVLLMSCDEASRDRLSAHLHALGATVDAEAIDSAPIWTKTGNEMLDSIRTLRRLRRCVSWLQQTAR